MKKGLLLLAILAAMVSASAQDETLQRTCEELTRIHQHLQRTDPDHPLIRSSADTVKKCASVAPENESKVPEIFDEGIYDNRYFGLEQEENCKRIQLQLNDLLLAYTEKSPLVKEAKKNLDQCLDALEKRPYEYKYPLQENLEPEQPLET